MSDENETEEDVSALRKAAKDGASAKREAELARRELAFVKAGVDTDSKPAQALLKSYEGELTTEAIVAEAKEWSLVPGPEDAPPVEEVVEDNSEAAQAQAIRETLSEGNAAPNTPPEKGGVDKAFQQFLTDKEDGMSQVEATNRAFGAVIKAAAQGDKQATYNQRDWEEKAGRFGHGAEYAS